MSESLQPNQVLSAELEVQEWNIVLAGLGEMPLKFAGPVANKLRPQLEAAGRAAPQPQASPPQAYKGNGPRGRQPDVGRPLPSDPA